MPLLVSSRAGLLKASAPTCHASNGARSSYQKPLGSVAVHRAPFGLAPRQQQWQRGSTLVTLASSPTSALPLPEISEEARAIFDEFFIKRPSAVDNTVVQYILQHPYIAVVISVPLVYFAPKVVKILIKKAGVPVLLGLLAWLLLIHPKALLEVLQETETLIETQPVTTSMLVFGLATLLAAPSLVAASGTAATAYFMLNLALSQGLFDPDDFAPASTPIRTFQSKLDKASREAQARGVTPPPSLPAAPDLSAIPVPDLSAVKSALPNVPVPPLPDVSGLSFKAPELPSGFPTLPNFSGFKLPEFSGFKGPDLSGFKGPDLSGFKAPAMPTLTSSKPAAIDTPAAPVASYEQPQEAASYYEEEPQEAESYYEEAQEPEEGFSYFEAEPQESVSYFEEEQPEQAVASAKEEPEEAVAPAKEESEPAVASEPEQPQKAVADEDEKDALVKGMEWEALGLP